MPHRFAAPPAALAVALLAACNNNGSSISAPFASSTVAPSGTVTLRSPGTPSVPALVVSIPAFANGGAIPAVEAFNGCGGSNQSPAISWSGAPAATKSFVLTEFDPDAPTGVGFWHWTLFNIPPTVTSIAAGTGTAPAAGTSGLNDYGSLGYGGPCPPPGDGAHHYHFTVSALDTTLTGMPANTTGAYLTFNMRGHIIAQGTYVGTYSQ